MPRILIIDDDETMCYALARTVKRMGCEAVSAGTLAAARSLTAESSFDIIFLDVRLPDGNGLSILKELAARPSRPEVIIVTAQGDPEGAELAIASGAWDYIDKNYSIQQISLTLKRALDYRSARACDPLTDTSTALTRNRIIGESPVLARALEQVSQAAGSEANVLITGETGTGKELFARAIHQNSNRAKGPFIIVDCATLPETIAPSILFGHKKGAFTGADKDQDGLIVQADKGTLFLDEVGELPPAVQKNFLRVLQERVVRPLGDREEKKSDFRILAATNRNLDTMVTAETFRSDLLFRLRAMHILLPPLRERVGDIRLLAQHFIDFYENRISGAPKTCSTDFMDILEGHDWPGNVRELIHTVEHACAAARLDPYFYPQHLPAGMRARYARSRVTPAADTGEGSQDLLDTQSFPHLQNYRDEIWTRAEYRYLRALLDETGGSVKDVIRMSGLSQSRLYALLKKHGLLPRSAERS